MKIKAFVKRTICIILSVTVLFFGVSNSYFSPHKMDTVQATGAELVVVAGISASTLFQICLFVGTTAVAIWGIGELIDNQDEIAQVGKNLIDSAKSLPDGWAFKMTDTSGQDYVFGTEALQEVQDTQWEVIQGGSPNNNNDDNNNDDDNNKNKFKLPTKSSNELVGSWLALGGVWLTDLASKWYANHANGTMTDSDKSLIQPLTNGWLTNDVLTNQWSGNTYTFNNAWSFDIWNSVKCLESRYYTLSGETNVPCGLYFKKLDEKCFSIGYGTKNNINVIGQLSTYYDGVLMNTNTNSLGFTYGTSYNLKNVNYNFSVPLFSSEQALVNYLNSGECIDALNYAQTYREADWLTDDWAGVLIEPLTNINLTLSQLLDVAKALGLKAVGNNLRPEELADLIANSLPKINPELLPGVSTDPVIVPNPALDPIYYPYSDAHPQPGQDPNIGVETGTGTDSEPVPDIDPTEPIETITPEEAVEETKDNLKDLAGGFKNKFPFCIPWDLQYLYSVLADNPKTPVFKLPLVLERYGIHEDVVIDMSNFEGLSKISRLFFTLLYIYGLINFTVKVVLVRKEE